MPGYNPTYPPTIPSNARDNTTVMQNTHPADHVAIANALSSIVGVLGNDPAANTVSGLTTIAQRIAGSGRVALLTVAAQNASAAWKSSANVVCDGSKDDSAIIHDAINFQAFVNGQQGLDVGGIILLSEGDFVFGSTGTVSTIGLGQDGFYIMGMGKGRTRVKRSANGVMFGLGGSRSGGTTILRDNSGLANMSIDGGNFSSSAVQVWYGHHNVIADMEFTNVGGSAVEYVETISSTMRNVLMTRCGSRNGGTTNAAVHVWRDKPGSVAGASGSGGQPCRDLVFDRLQFIDYNDGALWIQGGTENDFHNRISMSNSRLDTTTVRGVSLNLDHVNQGNFVNVNLAQGVAFENQTVAQDTILMTNCNGLNFSNIAVYAQGTGTRTMKSGFAFRGGNTGVNVLGATFHGTTTNYPTVAWMDWTGGNSTIETGAILIAENPGGFSTPLRNFNQITNNTRMKNAGTSTIASGTTSLSVTHNMVWAPTPQQISILPENSMGNATKFWIDAASINDVTFTVHVNTDPGATTAILGWKIDMLLPSGAPEL